MRGAGVRGRSPCSLVDMLRLVDLPAHEECQVERIRTTARRVGGAQVSFPDQFERKGNGHSLLFYIDNMKDVDMGHFSRQIAPALICIKHCPFKDACVSSRLGCYMSTRPTAHLRVARLVCLLSAALAGGLVLMRPVIQNS